jgi:hypothetical protein
MQIEEVKEDSKVDEQTKKINDADDIIYTQSTKGKDQDSTT